MRRLHLALRVALCVAFATAALPHRRTAAQPAAAQPAAAVELLDRHLPLAAEATIGTVWGDRYFYVANSQWEQYDDAGRLKPGARLEPLRILELRLP